MIYVEQSELINCRLEEVYEFIIDGENNRLWNKTINKIQRVPDTEDIKEGTVFIQQFKFPDGKIIDADFKIIECIKNEKISFKVLKGPYSPIGTYKFQAIKDNATKVTLSMQDEGENDVNSKKYKHLVNVASSIEKIKRYLEGKYK